MACIIFDPSFFCNISAKVFKVLLKNQISMQQTEKHSFEIFAKILPHEDEESFIMLIIVAIYFKPSYMHCISL